MGMEEVGIGEEMGGEGHRWERRKRWDVDGKKKWRMLNECGGKWEDWGMCGGKGKRWGMGGVETRGRGREGRGRGGGGAWVLVQDRRWWGMGGREESGAWLGGEGNEVGHG